MKRIILICLFSITLFGQSTIGEHIDIDASGNVTIAGWLKYEYAHVVAGATGLSYTPTITKDVYLKIAPTMATLEADYVTFAGDTATIINPGDYFIMYTARHSAANANDVWEVQLRKNAVDSEVSQFIYRTTAAGLSDTKTYFWYLKNLVAGDDLSFWITNLTASRNPTFVDIKIFIEQKPE